MIATRRLAAILAADVAGYSRLMGADEEGTLERLKALRRELLDPKITEHRGRIVKTTGDGMLVEFSSVVDAVRCAVAVQQAMPERDASVAADNRIELRIGINLGDVIVEGDDLYGDGVNIAARIEALADAGGVFVSNTVHDHVRDRLPFVFEDLGEQPVKNIARPVRIYRVRTTLTHPAATAPGSPLSRTAGEGAERQRREADEGTSPPLALPDKPSIAVLPFQNISGDPEQEYFADGMVEEIITALSRIRWFFVIARNSTFTYKGRAVDVKQVARELGVRYVLEGSVRKSGNRIRVTAQLVEAATGNHVWAERYDRDLADIFAVQDEITERVVAAIEPELYAAEQVRSQSKPPDSLDAWECVLRALSLIGKGTRDENTEAEALCRRAIAIAPGYGRAHSLLAWVLLRRTVWSGDLRTVVPEISAELHTAFAIDDRDPWAYFAQGILLLRLHRFGEAVRTLRRALELNPNFALAHAFLANVLATQGTHQEAVNSAEHALRLSPRDRLVGLYSSLAMTIADFAAGRYPECVTWARNMIEKSPEHLAGHFYLTAALAMGGELTAVGEARDTLLRIRPEFSLTWMNENMPPTGELAERLREGLRKAGVPEE
jgi:TolB-like protein/class 3 adenylate cyclase/Flp pilus assembly protein TadD